ncbi:MAG: hypothetical protein RR795_01180 [Cetobacterium sp.]|uniref:hypothetical protein n=2 Tax=Cetobacterium sp. TaxID=2071632 RepID=UPI002FCC99B6
MIIAKKLKSVMVVFIIEQKGETMKLPILALIEKVLTIFDKTTKNAEKDQDFKQLKHKEYSSIISLISLIVLIICILNSIFPYTFKIDSWIYDLNEKLINYILT